MATDFHTSLFSCWSHGKICCFTLCCPCVQAAYNKAEIDGRSCTCCDCLCMPGEYFTRSQIRSTYGLMGDKACDDVCATCLCYLCAVCQDAREIEYQKTKTAGGPSNVYMR
jgi:Cys-rich protein (TIGR01571 family)